MRQFSFKRSLMTVAVAMAFLAVSAGQVRADLIVGAISATTNMGQSFLLSNALNQSGLSSNYTSGVTDFATYTALATHDSQPGNDWVSNQVSGNVTFNLGSSQNIGKVAIWNFGGLGGSIGYGILQFTLEASNDSTFSTFTNLGTYNTSVYSTLNPAQVFSFSAINAQYFRLTDFTNNGASALGLGEIAFATTAVPVPSGILLAGMGVIALGAFARLRRRNPTLA